ncbi:CRISPR-associated protein Cas2 [Aeropyrum pernix K1]|uniref:CRISPR-associated endoribonuclease Cas2 n=1 Tax=Aeropyrum pernix (strain ATCC 700893 / DSM 11879 / JCM 9820 / NBRC 100138 / K1) TaxID=272557 RepID=CAS2_AERPE|nr:RecName: Full=CRISPR-associated endoribonuclease Cas2 [Aeropyrum pernix K1]BAF34780.1 CRISPR-associated protein Cas2 [Aeropyrum pernix K1]
MVYVLIAYDISNDSKRLKAAQKLLQMGFARVQKSVYIAKGGRSLAKEAYRALQRLADSGKDKIMVMVIPGDSVRDAYGLGGSLEDGKRVVVV